MDHANDSTENYTAYSEDILAKTNPEIETFIMQVRLLTEKGIKAAGSKALKATL